MLRTACAVAGLLFLALAPASATTFSLDPVVLTVSGSHDSTFFTITNQSTSDLRIQLSAFAWDQHSDGKMVLTDTDDVVVYPQLFTIEPLGTRRVRVAATASVTDREKSYRIVVEELPALATDGSVETVGVSVRLRLNAPLFLQPDKLITAAEITQAHVQNGKLHFAIANIGTAHIMTSHIALSRRQADRNVPIDQKVDGWYILAGGERVYDIALPPKSCVPDSDLTIELDAGSRHLVDRMHLATDACRT